MHLAELALEFAVQHLKPGGNFLVKVFQGAGFEEYVRTMRGHFEQVADAQAGSLARSQQRSLSVGQGLKPARRSAADEPSKAV